MHQLLNLVHIVSSPEEAKMFAEQMLGHKLVTKQTSAEGKICNTVIDFIYMSFFLILL